MNPTPKPAPRTQKSDPAERPKRLSKTFWRLAAGTGVHTQSNDPIDVVKHLLAALGGLEGKRSDSQITADALSFLLRLEDDPRYASPEQTRGGEKDRKALVFSLGVLLFERLTGHHPFVESLSPVQAALVRDRCNKRGANNLCSLPGELRAIINKALSPFADDRFDGVAELRAALIRFVANATLSQARASGSPPMTARPGIPAPTQLRRNKRPTPPPCPGSAKRDAYDERRRSLDRVKTVAAPPPVPSAKTAAAVPTEKSPKTKRASAADAVHAATAKQKKRDATPTPTCGEVQTDLSLRLVSQRQVIRAVLALGVGAFALLIVVVAMNWPSASPSQAPAATAAAMSDAEQAEAVPAAPSSAEAVRPPMVAALPQAESGDEADAEAEEAEIELPPDTMIRFDPEVGGQLALEAARECFSDKRLKKSFQLGLSLRYHAADGLSNRVYLAPDHGLSKAERRCVRETLVGLAAAGPPERSTIVTYTLWFTPDGGRHRGRVQP